jgi:quinol monooxygenase YgiN
LSGHHNEKTPLIFDGGIIMAVKVLIQRKITPGKENELGEAIKDIRFRVVQAQGFISGETLRSVEDPSIHLVISAWKSIEDWNSWVNTAERKAFEETIAAVLAEPEKISTYQTDTYFDVKGMVETLAEGIVVAD